MSRTFYPKQLLPLTGDKRLLQEAALRVAAAPGFAAPLVIANEEHRFIIAEQLREIDIAPQSLLLEPVGRNTAPAACIAALALAESDPDKDAAGNTLIGNVVAEDTKNCYLRSESGLVAALGIEDLIVVATDDAVMLAPRDRAQDVRLLVARLAKENRAEADALPLVHRPWGTYQTLHAGHRVQVKHIMVKPGGKLSLQMHHHRAEHWVVVQGTAKIRRGDDEIILTEDQSTYIPLGTAHRLENPGKIPLHLIEVQSGAYLGEDDIVRFEDHYGRI